MLLGAVQSSFEFHARCLPPHSLYFGAEHGVFSLDFGAGQGALLTETLVGAHKNAVQCPIGHGEA